MFIVLLILWFILNGNFELETIIYGVICCLLVSLFCRFFLNYRLPTAKSLKKLWRYILYAFYVVGQIFLSCLAVGRLIFSGRQPRPELITFNPGLKKDLSKVLLANSITLTPGTITANVRGDTFYVHALDRDFGKGIENCGFVKRLKKLEEDEI